MSILQGILKNTVFLTAANLIARLLGVFFVALMARAVGPAGIGLYSYGLSLIAVFMILPGFGFDALLTREIAKNKGRAAELLANVLAVKLTLSAVASALLVALIHWKQYERSSVAVLVVLLVSAILTSLLVTMYSIFRAHERMDVESLLVVGNSVVRVALGITAIQLGFGLVGILVGLLISDLFSFSLALWVARRLFVPVRVRLTPDTARTICRTTIPFGVMTLINVVFINTDNLVIRRIQGDEAVGWFAAASRIMTFVLLIPHMFMTAVYPVLSRLSVDAEQSLRHTYAKSFSYLLMLAFPVAVGGTLVAEELILVIFGEAFRHSVVVFRIMAWFAIFEFAGYINGTTLMATNREKLFAGTWSGFMLANIVLDYLFVKRFGYIGACYVTLILGTLMFVLYSVLCHRQLRLSPDWVLLGKAATAAAFMGAGLFACSQITTQLVVMVPLGVVLFAAAVLLLRVVPGEDRRALWACLPWLDRRSRTAGRPRA